MKYIDAEKLIAEIERWRDKAKEKYNESTYSMGRCDALAEFRNHIVSLQQEQPSLPSNLDEAAQKVEDYYDVGEERGYLCCHRGDIKGAFKAGAEWMAGQGKTKEAIDSFNVNPAFIAGYKEAEKDLIPLINRLCEAILFDWDNKAELAWKIQSQIKEDTK